jgi:diadenosine tetraphosphatase ApaH/serine/threonine PP2A family protein phosphatase
VVDDARDAGATRFVLGGDYALFGAFPEEVVKRMGKLDADLIRGNTDRWLEDPSDAPGNELVHRSIEFCQGRLGSKRTGKLFALPEVLDIGGACVCHASPRSDMLTFMPEATEGDRQLLAGTRAEVVIFGHSHLQFTRETDDSRLLVNPGSVGLPFDGDRRAAYALWNGGRDFELRRVPYDSDRYAQEVRKRMSKQLGPNIDTLVRRVEQAAMVS